MSEKFAITEEECSELIEFVQNVTEKINESGKKVVRCCNDYFETYYNEPVFKLAEGFIESFNGEFKKEILSSVSEWKSGKTSLVYLAENAYLGEEAIDIAGNTEDSLETTIESIEITDEIEVAISGGHFTDEANNSLAENIKNISNDIESEMDSIMQRMDTLSEENRAFTPAANLVNPVATSIKALLVQLSSSFNQFTSRLNEAGHTIAEDNVDAESETSNEMKKRTEAMHEELHQILTSKFESI